MGNSKNKLVYGRKRNHVYVQRNPQKWMRKKQTPNDNPTSSTPNAPAPTNPTLTAPAPTSPTPTPAPTSPTSPDGARIINLDMLETYLNDFTKHILTCSKAKEIENKKERIKIQGETRQGLASILNVKCIGCGETIDLTTSKKILGPKQTKRWECNLASVWGQMASGGGHSTLREEMAVLGVPIMTEKSFIHIERDIGTWWEQELNKSMKQAGEEERRLAIEHNEYHEGIPAITVILDGL